MPTLSRLSIAEFLGCLIDHVEAGTGLRCYDDPNNKEPPFYSVQFLKSEPVDSKTMFLDKYQVWIHCIGEPVRPYSNAPVLALVQQLEETMTSELAMPEGFALWRQEYGGLQALKEDETHEGHAVLSYDFHICYGFRCK